MISPRANKLQQQTKNPEQFNRQSPKSKIVKFSKAQRSQLSPNFDTRSQRSHHSRKSARSNVSMKSFETLRSRQLLKNHVPCHDVGYSNQQIQDAISYIFETYDNNQNNLLDGQQVFDLVKDSLKHIGCNHEPTKLEIAEFIQHIDKNNDGRLSKNELERAFYRGSHNIN